MRIFDPVIAVVGDEDVKISDVWSENIEKKEKAEKVLAEYSALFLQLHYGIIDAGVFVKRMFDMKPEATDPQELFSALQSFHYRKMLLGGDESTAVSLEPVQNSETIDAIREGIISRGINEPTNSAVISNSLPLVPDVTTEEGSSDVTLTGDDPSIIVYKI
ncbi:hypothetical protein [Candidatus Tisiphia endosymbiont of Oplodontha viridula]|uniref:hypothetical protein n=1 Tax=Candidatus Tisiphia endosymbiont of Oplodontha viridula TaxID=3077925 RepID=UPI0035C8B9A9